MLRSNTVLHADVHALASLRAVRMYGIAGEEDTFLQAETIANSLPDLIAGETLAIPMKLERTPVTYAVHQSQYR